jgi:hypothetical protein
LVSHGHLIFHKHLLKKWLENYLLSFIVIFHALHHKCTIFHMKTHLRTTSLKILFLFSRFLWHSFLSNIPFVFLFESLNYESETLIESTIQRWKSFKVYHTRQKGPSLYYNFFYPIFFIHIKINESKAVKIFKRTIFEPLKFYIPS